MADGSGGWASPSGGQGGEEPPRYGERAPGWTPAPQQPGAAPAQQTYAPPPRRGLIPLHPLSFGQLLGASFGVIRWNPRATIVPALIVVVLNTGLTFGWIALFAFAALDRLSRAATPDAALTILSGLIGGSILLGILIFAVGVFTGALLQGMLVTVVAGAAEGVRVGFGAGLRSALRRVLPLLGIAFLLGALQVLAAGLLVVLVVVIAQIRDVGVPLAIVTGILGGIGYIIGYAFIAVKLATVPSAVVLERRGVFSAIGRSWVLLRGSFWRTFGLLALVLVMVGVAAQLASVPFTLIGSALIGLLYPNAGSGAPTTDTFIPIVLGTLPGTIASAIVTGIGQVAQVAAVVLVYLDVRMRREGLDIELQRYVEEGGPNPLERQG